MVAEDDDDTGVLGAGSRIEHTAAGGVYVIQGDHVDEADTGWETFHVDII